MKKNKNKKKIIYYKVDELIEATRSYLKETFPEIPCSSASEQIIKIFSNIEATEKSIAKKNVTKISVSTLEKAPFADIKSSFLKKKCQEVVVKTIINGIKKKFSELGFHAIER